MDMIVGLNASEQLTPARDLIKAGVKPFRLTVVFDYVEFRQAQPYGNTEVTEHLTEVKNEEYFMEGVEIPYDELKTHLEAHFPEVDLDELTEKLVAKALDEFHKP
jgi:hypothetical protein